MKNIKFNLSKIFASIFLAFLFVFAANAQTADRPLKVLKKEPPNVRVFAECFRSYGISYAEIQVRVTFDKSGKITDVEVVKSSECREFDEESLRVARRIKFEPAIKDGEPITVTKIVVYQGGVR